MNELPAELLPIVAGYLPPPDAIRLNNACKASNSKLALTSTVPCRILNRFSRRDRDDDPHCGFHIPVPHQVCCHSILLSLIWGDQGWGNRKGRVFVVAAEKDRSYDESAGGFADRRVVFASPIARHEVRRLNIAFQPKRNEAYHLWYVVGGGGGHSLLLYSVTIQALVFDDPSRSFGTAHSFLARAEALAAWDEKTGMIIHLDVEQFILTQRQHFLPPLTSFMERQSVSGADLWRKLTGYIQSLWESWMEDYFAYSKMMADAPSQAGISREELRRLHALRLDDFPE